MPSITSAPTASDYRREAERFTQARTTASDHAAVAMAELCRQAKGAIYNAIAESRHGLIEEEAVSVIEAGELARALLAALVADGDVVERGGVFSTPQVAA